jgi:hypothetical protein
MAMREKVNFGKLRAEVELDAKAVRIGGDPFNEDTPTGALLIDGCTFTIGTEDTNVINVGMQLRAGKADLARLGHVRAYLSDAATGIGISGTAPATSVAIGTDGAIIVTETAKLAWWLQSEVEGDIDLDITDTTGATWYMVVVANGIQYVSDAITFTS